MIKIESFTEAWEAFREWKSFVRWFPKDKAEFGIYSLYHDGPVLSINLWFMDICWCGNNGIKEKRKTK